MDSITIQKSYKGKKKTNRRNKYTVFEFDEKHIIWAKNCLILKKCENEKCCKFNDERDKKLLQDPCFPMYLIVKENGFLSFKERKKVFKCILPNK